MKAFTMILIPPALTSILESLRSHSGELVIHYSTKQSDNPTLFQYRISKSWFETTQCPHLTQYNCGRWYPDVGLGQNAAKRLAEALQGKMES